MSELSIIDRMVLALVVEAAKTGYMAGHNDTVEGMYGDPDEIAVDIATEVFGQLAGKLGN